MNIILIISLFFLQINDGFAEYLRSSRILVRLFAKKLPFFFMSRIQMEHFSCRIIDLKLLIYYFILAWSSDKHVSVFAQHSFLRKHCIAFRYSKKATNYLPKTYIFNYLLCRFMLGWCGLLLSLSSAQRGDYRWLGGIIPAAFHPVLCVSIYISVPGLFNRCYWHSYCKWNRLCILRATDILHADKRNLGNCCL